MSEEDVDLGQVVGNFPESDDLAFAVELENVSEHSIALLDTRYGDSYGKSRGKSKADWFGQFLFSIEYIGGAGKNLDHPEVELVDVLSPVEGSLVTTIEPGARRRFLLRPMKWLRVMSPTLEAGQYRAVVHYHGLPENAVDHRPELKSDRDAVRAWSGTVQSPPVKFEIKASLHFAEIQWGETAGGLRSALELVPHKSEYVGGDKLDLKLHVQNVSEKPITLSTHLWLSDMHATVKDLRDNELDVRARFYTGWTLSGRITLRPQQITTLDAGNLAIAADQRQADRFGHVTNRTLVAPAGTYSIQLSGHFGAPGFKLRDGEGKQLAPLEGDWAGMLTTGCTPLVISKSDVR